MTSKPENPPAFPLPAVMPTASTAGNTTFHTAYQPAQAGMTLRDYFAGQALVGIVAHPECRNRDSDSIPRDAYKLADAMLKARKP